MTYHEIYIILFGLLLDINECTAGTDLCDAATTVCENREINKDNMKYKCQCIAGYSAVSGSDTKCEGMYLMIITDC